MSARRCPDCHTIHPTDLARAIGRFTNKPRYKAQYDGAPTRTTRAQAEQDACKRIQEGQ